MIHQLFISIAALSLLILPMPGFAQEREIPADIAAKAADVVKDGAAAMKKPAEPVHSELLENAPLPGDFMIGDKKAPVTVIEYASLTCPHCAHFHTEVVPMIEHDYVAKGKVRYILRPYPLNEPALKAAELVDCVGEEGGPERYYTFVKVLFDAQNKWAFDTTYMTALETFAGVGGVPKETFDKCTSDPEREKKILKVRKAATDELKVSHTPYVFVNTLPYEGPPTPESFSKAIEDALAKK